MEESKFDVAITKVGVNRDLKGRNPFQISGVNDLLNCRGDIDQINNILQNIEHIVYKC